MIKPFDAMAIVQFNSLHTIALGGMPDADSHEGQERPCRIIATSLSRAQSHHIRPSFLVGLRKKIAGSSVDVNKTFISQVSIAHNPWPLF